MLKLYNSLTRKKEVFKPLKNKNAGMYSCGPTVYDHPHIGNLRAYIFSDLVRRALREEGYRVKHIINITDVGHLTSDEDRGEDKLVASAAREKKSAWDIARAYTDEFNMNLAELNIMKPSKEPRATDHIREQIDSIKKLEDKGYIYRTSDGIYFDTSKFKDYGKLARIDTKGLRAGARIAIGEKKHPTDFALWKFSPAGVRREMEWQSPWGKGFPGWHIECSAMARKYLGQPFDIHTGGVDHLSIHHPNEMAQSEAAFGLPLAHIWMHSEFLLIDGKKMSKSLGNFYTLGTIKEKGFDPASYRFFVLLAHYRHKLNFTWEGLQAAEAGLSRLNEFASKNLELQDKKISRPLQAALIKKYDREFKDAMRDDLNTPRALAAIFDFMKEVKKGDAFGKTIYRTLILWDKTLGLRLGGQKTSKKENVPRAVQKLVAERETARKEKRWSDADAIRDEIQKLGYTIEDTPKGPTLSSPQK